MHWVQLSLSCGADQAEQAADTLSAFGALSVSFDNDASPAVLEPLPGENPLWQRVRVTGLFGEDPDSTLIAQRLREHLPADLVATLAVETLAERCWERECLERLHPLRFGRLWVRPRGHDTPEGEPAITLDPGLAFGTGTHPTTALCLEWLATAPLDGVRLIDYGCGSGILALAALRLGAAHAWAVDHDPQALCATAANAVENDLSERVTCTHPRDLATAGVDLLVANILAAPLDELAPRFAELVREGGRVVISGLLNEQVSRTLSRYRQYFTPEYRALRDDWACLGFVK